MFCVCCSFLIMLFSCSSMGSPPWGIVLHQLLQHGSFLQAAAPEELLQCETFPQGAVLQGQTAAVWVALGGQRSCQKNFSGVLSTACTFPQVTSICSGMETSTACRVSALQAASEPSSREWSPPCPPSLTLVSEGLFPSYSVLSHSSCAAVLTLLYTCCHRAAAPVSAADRPSFGQWQDFYCRMLSGKRQNII